MLFGEGACETGPSAEPECTSPHELEKDSKFEIEKETERGDWLLAG